MKGNAERRIRGIFVVDYNYFSCQLHCLKGATEYGRSELEPCLLTLNIGQFGDVFNEVLSSLGIIH